MTPRSITVVITPHELGGRHWISAVVWGISAGRYQSIAGATLPADGAWPPGDPEELFSMAFQALYAACYHS